MSDNSVLKEGETKKESKSIGNVLETSHIESSDISNVSNSFVRTTTYNLENLNGCTIDVSLNNESISLYELGINMNYILKEAEVSAGNLLRLFFLFIMEGNELSEEDFDTHRAAEGIVVRSLRDIIVYHNLVDKLVEKAEQLQKQLDELQEDQRKTPTRQNKL